MILAYVFIPVLQKELDVFRETVWNTHRIRKQKDTILPDGIPNHIYAFPEEYGMNECGMFERVLYDINNSSQDCNMLGSDLFQNIAMLGSVEQATSLVNILINRNLCS